MSDKKLIYIIGMGRSGTSALTRVLALCGGTLPERLVPPVDTFNPTGLWESIDVLTLNENFFERFGSSWSDPSFRLFEETAFKENAKDEFIEKARTFLAGCPRGPVLVVKEMRISVLASLWFEAAIREGFVVHIVVSVRHPREVAKSWVTAQLPVPSSDALWLKYNLLAERYSRCFPRIFVNYSNLLRDWKSQVSRIAKMLSVPLRIDDEISTQVNEFLTEDLYRQRCAELASEIFGESCVGRTYAILSSAALDQPIDLLQLDEIYHTYASGERALRQLVSGDKAVWKYESDVVSQGDTTAKSSTALESVGPSSATYEGQPARVRVVDASMGNPKGARGNEAFNATRVAGDGRTL